MRARRLAFAIVTVLLVQLLPAGAGSKGLAAEFHSANMTHIKHIPQQNIERTAEGGGGSDIAFVSLDVTEFPEGSPSLRGSRCSSPSSTARGKSFSPSAYAALVAKRGPRPAWQDVKPYCLLKSSTSPAIKKRR